MEGVRVDSKTYVKDMVVESDIVKTKMSTLVRGARVVSKQANFDGSYQVVRIHGYSWILCCLYDVLYVSRNRTFVPGTVLHSMLFLKQETKA
ncbi:hypothetical protein SOV_47820 [Sporomusa ovata DSM 2662]|nr:hypothetical protein SOV_2c00510 [Sporomusa ovata DSM 2662]